MYKKNEICVKLNWQPSERIASVLCAWKYFANRRGASHLKRECTPSTSQNTHVKHKSHTKPTHIVDTEITYADVWYDFEYLGWFEFGSYICAGRMSTSLWALNRLCHSWETTNNRINVHIQTSWAIYMNPSCFFFVYGKWLFRSWVFVFLLLLLWWWWQHIIYCRISIKYSTSGVRKFNHNRKWSNR